MTKINIITDNSSQTMLVKLESGQFFNLTLWYSYNQQGWFYSITYGAYSLNNRRVVNSSNLLRAVQNVIPFGLACIVTDIYEPIFIDDFKKGRATFYTLSPTDVQLVESLL